MTKYGFRDNKITTARVTTDDLQATTKVIGTSEIEDAAITAAKLASNAVETAKIKDGAVSTAKVADSAISAAKLAADAVETAKIKDAAVSSAKVADGAISAAKLAADAVETAKIKNAAVTTDKIADEAVTAPKLAGWTHGSISVDFGSVNAHQTVTKEVAVSGIKKGDPVVACFFEDPGASMAIVGAYGSQDGSITFIALETGGVTQDLGAKVVNFFAMTE